MIIRKFLLGAEKEGVALASGISDFITGLESTPGVKVLEKTTKHIVVALEANIDIISSRAPFQKAFDDLEAKVKKDIEALGNVTVRDVVDFDINVVKRLYLFVKKVVQKIFKK